MKLFIDPQFHGADNGQGGIRRVVEAQNRYLPALGYEIVEHAWQADICAVHGGNTVETDRPTVNHCHGLYWSNYEWPKWAQDINNKVVRSIRRADLTTAPSRWVAQVLKRSMLIDCPVAYSGVDVDEFSVTQHKNYVLWNKTRIDPVCDPSVVNKLAIMAQDTHFVSTFGEPAPNLTLTGKTTYTEALRWVSEAQVYLCTARETFGIGTLEAMACGVPVLAFDFAGQREIIEHKVDGYLARDYDDLLTGLRYCIENRVKMSIAARQKVVDKFQWKDRIKDYAAAYEMVQGEDRRISVVVPSYNLGRYLKQCVESALEADEVIIVDDASTDDSLEIAQDLVREHSNVKVIRNGINQYLANTLNIGIEAASHDYILPLDPDNWLEKGMLQVLKGELDKSRDIDIAYGSLRFLREDGFPDTRVSADGISLWPPRDFDYKKQMQFPFTGVPSTSMFRRKAWRTAGGYRSRYRTGEDADFWCRLTTLGYIPKKVTDAVVLNYRNRADSMSHTVDRDDWVAWYPNKPYTAVAQPVDIMMGEPVVSIIVYGQGKAIDTLDSIWAQTYRLWEVVESNRVADALNNAMVQGKYIYLLKAGDYIAKTTLEALLSVIGDGFASSECKDPRQPFIDCSGLMFPRSFDSDFTSDIDFMFRLASKLCGTTIDSGFTRGMGDLQVVDVPSEWRDVELACGACGQRTPFIVQPMLGERPDGDMVLLEYSNIQEGVRTYRGKATGQSYRFSTDEGHNTKYVHAKDAPALLELGVFTTK